MRAQDNTATLGAKTIQPSTQNKEECPDTLV